jgi:hypothetical protein
MSLFLNLAPSRTLKEDNFKKGTVKGIVQRKLTRVKSGVNR